MTNVRALYAAFDRFPSRKGAAIHIDRFARALFAEFGHGCLYVLGGPHLPARQIEGEAEIIRFSEDVPNFLERAMAFGAQLARAVAEHASTLEICHYRDPWSGAAIVRGDRTYATLFEVNALPSIEIPYLFPAVGPKTLEKVRSLEMRCLEDADLVITPSLTTASFLSSLGIPKEKVRVIPNGADLDQSRPRPADAPDDYLLYFGSPQSWQGVDTLLRAFALLADFENLRLVICASRDGHAWKRHQKLASRLELDQRIIWKYALEEEDLSAWRQHALVSVAPLTDCSRNTTQGCAPLKILESMASGVAVVASNVAPVRELITDRRDGWLVHPERPSELARALRILLDDRALAQRLGAEARRTIESRFTWSRSLEMLRGEYQRLKGAKWASERSIAR